MLNRRDFLRAPSLLVFAPTVPVFLAKTAVASTNAKDSRVLCVVQLNGGNDALNTIVPHTDPNYARLRPTFAVRQNDLIWLNDTLGMRLSLRPLSGLLEAGQLAVVPGVGYSDPSRSHFTGMAVWHTARLDSADHTGYGIVQPQYAPAHRQDHRPMAPGQRRECRLIRTHHIGVKQRAVRAARLG